MHLKEHEWFNSNFELLVEKLVPINQNSIKLPKFLSQRIREYLLKPI